VCTHFSLEIRSLGGKLMGISKFWQHAALQLHYHQEGQGPPFFLIHGFSPKLDWQVWEHTIPILAKHHMVFAFDMIGHGQSTKVEPKPSTQEQAQLLVTMIQEQNFEEVSLGGVSWGGAICQLIASTIPKQIKRLLLVSSSGYRLSEKVLRPTQEIPTLILWSKEDAVIPLANGQQLAQKLPKARFVVIPPVSGVSKWQAHHPQRFKPDLTNPHIQSFIEESK
jgi:pimeloyl-ACP methyl ester carboxylesterase